jgi:itaconate CoA-transferase
MSVGNKPLDGVVVVALEQAVAAPIATCRLADAGARVIKIERPEVGDFAREYDKAANGVSSYFGWSNRGKESIALDLRDDDDMAVMLALLDRADVFIQNLAVGASDRLGLDAATLIERDPELIVCDLSGYGPVGPYAHMKAYDLLVQAESGLLSVSGAPGPLGRIGVSVVDIATGTNAALGITTALVRKANGGGGAHLTTSLFQTMAEWMTVPLLHHDYLGAAPERVGLAHPSIAPYGGFETADGRTVLIAVQADREFADLCAGVLDRPELASTQGFVTNHERVTNRSATDAAVAEVFATLDSDELMARLVKARIAHAVVSDVARLSEHPQLRRIEVATEVGSFKLPAPPVTADWESFGPVPALDEHGAAIRAELGL